jgi:hypothetical protein
LRFVPMLAGRSKRPFLQANLSLQRNACAAFDNIGTIDI